MFKIGHEFATWLQGASLSTKRVSPPFFIDTSELAYSPSIDILKSHARLNSRAARAQSKTVFLTGGDP